MTGGVSVEYIQKVYTFFARGEGVNFENYVYYLCVFWGMGDEMEPFIRLGGWGGVAWGSVTLHMLQKFV